MSHAAVIASQHVTHRPKNPKPKPKPKRNGEAKIKSEKTKSERRTSRTGGPPPIRRGPSTQVELSFSARKLANRDVLSKSDPICLIFRMPPNGCGPPREIARTETIRDNLNPDWSRRVKMDYFFEAKQPLIFKIFDIDDDNGPLEEQDFLGSARCDLADIVAAPNGYLVMKLGGAPLVKGDIIVHAQEVDQGQRETLCLELNARSIPKRIFSKPNPYLEFYRFLDDGSRQLAHRTEVVNGTATPEFAPMEIPVRNLCDGGRDSEFLVECYDHCGDGKSARFIGSCRTSLSELTSHPAPLQLFNERKARRAGYEHSGLVQIRSAHLRLDHTFLDYVAGGLQLEFAVGVDFTASNGVIHSATSLHYIDGEAPNQYEMAIRSVLEICQHYNRRKMFDATGFGAKVPPSFQISHLFPLDIIKMTRRVGGIDGVLNAYRTCLRTVELSGPTHFGPTIAEFAHKAAKMPKDGSQYQILLIITDGAITDMNRTKDLIIKASTLPISIIIIGVGSDEFEKMDRLDSDSTLLEYKGRQAKRDIVQFVPFRDFLPKSGHFSSEAEHEEIKRVLAREVLAEVPEQVTSYMRSMNLAPRPPVPNSPNGSMADLITEPINPAEPTKPIEIVEKKIDENGFPAANGDAHLADAFREAINGRLRRQENAPDSVSSSPLRIRPEGPAVNIARRPSWNDPNSPGCRRILPHVPN